MADTDVPTRIVERPYQTRAIRRVTQHFEDDHERAALLVMATGSGKTRTVIALTDMLMRILDDSKSHPKLRADIAFGGPETTKDNSEL